MLPPTFLLPKLKERGNCCLRCQSLDELLPLAPGMLSQQTYLFECGCSASVEDVEKCQIKTVTPDPSRICSDSDRTGPSASSESRHSGSDSSIVGTS